MRVSAGRESLSVASGFSGEKGVKIRQADPKNIAELMDMYGSDNDGGGSPANSEYYTAPPGTDEQYFHAANMASQTGKSVSVKSGGNGTSSIRQQDKINVKKNTISRSAGKAANKRARLSARSYLASVRGKVRRAGSVPNELVTQVKAAVGFSEKLGFVQTRETLSMSTQATYTDVSCLRFRLLLTLEKLE